MPKSPTLVLVVPTLVLLPLGLKRTSSLSMKPSPPRRTMNDSTLLLSSVSVGMISQLLIAPVAAPVSRKLAATYEFAAPLNAGKMPLLPWNQPVPSGAALLLTCTQPEAASVLTLSKPSERTVTACELPAAASSASPASTGFIVIHTSL